ncbi:hypothetical protein CHUAL_000237 [Chamberlinius hualienensis]
MKFLMHLVVCICMAIVWIDQRSTCHAQSYDNQCTRIKSQGSVQDMIGKAGIYYSIKIDNRNNSFLDNECFTFEVLKKNRGGSNEMIFTNGANEVLSDILLKQLAIGRGYYSSYHVNGIGNVYRIFTIVAVQKGTGYAFVDCAGRNGSAILEGYVVGFPGASPHKLASLKNKLIKRVKKATAIKHTGC